MEVIIVCFENYRELLSAMCEKYTQILILLNVRTRTNEWAIKIKACPLILQESLDGCRLAYESLQGLSFRKEILKGNFESDYFQRMYTGYTRLDMLQ